MPEDLSEDHNEDLADEINEHDDLWGTPGSRLIMDDESDDEIIILEPVNDEVSSQSTAVITEQMAAATIAVAPIAAAPTVVAPRKVLSQPKITAFMKK